MKTKTFRTNLRCGGCVAKVAAALDAEASVQDWKVDLDDKDRRLTVTGEDPDLERIQAIFEQAGYEAKPLGGFFKKLFG